MSLAALGLGVQQRHYLLFLLAAVTGGAFWYLDGLLTGFQYRFSTRLSEIEYTAYLINPVRFDGEYDDSEISAPRIWTTREFTGYPLGNDGRPRPSSDCRVGKPSRLKPDDIYRDLRHRFWRASVMFPHVVAVGLGLLLFIIFGALNLSSIDHLRL